MTRRRTSDSSHKKILAKALTKYQDGQLDEAGALCRKILKRMPREPSALHLMGVVHLMNGQREEAAEMLGRAADTDGNNPEIHTNLGAALRACGQLDDAEDSYRRAIALRPGQAQAHFNLGNLFREQGRLDEAIVEYSRACEIDPGYAGAYNNLGVAHEARDELGDAVHAFEAALAAEPLHVDAMRNLANIQRLQGRLDDSLQRYEALLAVQPDDVPSLNAFGVVLSELGKHPEAADAFRRALDLDPDYIDARVNLGNELCLEHAPDEAIAEFQRAVELDPHCADTIANYGHALRQSNRLADAIDAYERALSEDPENPEANFGAAVAHLSQGEFADGWRYYLDRETMRAQRREYDRAPLPQELAGRRVLVMWDQGLGDELFFLRFLPELRERMAWVAYCPDARLTDMLDRANIAHRIIRREDELDSFDLKISVADLPYLLQMQDDSPVPRAFFIPTQADREARMKQTLLGFGPPPYVGVTWRAGTPDRKRLLFKEAPIDGIASAIGDTKATVVALQRKPKPGEIEMLASAIDRPVHDMCAVNDDLEDMLALLRCIDEYVCVSNTNVHLRASLGKPCRILVPSPPEFRWMAEGRESPWFPEFPIYRQDRDGSWNTAFEQLKTDLAALETDT